MKRFNYLFEKVCSLENLQLADAIAQKGKSKQYGVIVHNRNRDENLLKLREMLLNNCYRTSRYTTFKVYEPKEREVFKLPYYPDRIVHHAIMNILEPVFVSVFTSDTYSCIKGRGIHAAVKKVKRALKDKESTKYCLKLDIKKFYPSIDHDILKTLLKRKLKDPDLLNLLFEIIDSAPGLPIGNYLSQYFANFYLTYFDHFVKEELKVKYYFRYADDLVLLSSDKDQLHKWLKEISHYLKVNLNLEVKHNYQVFPVESRGIDFLGYVFYHTHIRLRKTIKKNFAKMMSRNPNQQSFASYYGWATHADCKHLLKKLTDGKVFRIRNSIREKRVYRRQTEDRQVIKPADCSSQI